VLRANAVVGLENVVLWHERDISHSSAERVVLPDSTIALDYMLDRVVWLAEGLAVDPERMLRNLEASHGLVFSGRALLALVEAGASREAAYEIVQRNALRAWDEETSFRGLLEADPSAMALVDAAALDRVFDLESFLRHVDAIFDRTLDALEVEHV
jgi:adenylosuccinate lyase